ncbi:MAG: hypothetical protein WA208_06895 [Thermoanaerobaculia bacterium]
MRARTEGQSGTSLPEMLVTLAVTTALMLIIYALIDDAMRATMFGESHNDMTIMTQRVVNGLRGEILQSRVAFQEDAIGGAYRSALQIPSSLTRWSDTRLPVFQTEPTLDPDKGTGTDRRAGNALLLARQLEPLSVTYDADGDPVTPEVEVLVDRYRFDYYFLVRNNGRSFGRTGYYVDLMEARSVEYADYFQLSSLTPAQRQLVVPRVQAAGLTRAWDPGEAIGSAFYELAPAASGAFAAAVTSPTIAVARTASLLPETRGGRVSGAIEYSISFVPDSPVQPFPITSPMTFYAQPDPDAPKFPAGFEVKIAGPSGNRRVGVRLVLMSHYRAKTYESQQALLTASARF